MGNKLHFTKDSILATVALEADVSGVDCSEGLPNMTDPPPTGPFKIVVDKDLAAVILAPKASSRC